MDDAGSVHSPGVVDVVDGVVTWSGPAAAAPSRPVDDGQRRSPALLMPGMVDIHAHTPMLLLRGTGEGLPTDRWLVEVMWPREGRLEEDDVRGAMQLGASELLLQRRDDDQRDVLLRRCRRRGRGDGRTALHRRRPADRGARLRHASDPSTSSSRTSSGCAIGGAVTTSIEIGVGPHSAYALSRDALRRVSALVASDPMLVHTHVAEQPTEVDEVTARDRPDGARLPRRARPPDSPHGRRALRVGDAGRHRADGGARRRAWRTVLPRTAITPVGSRRCAAMRAAGITVGIATDGPASHDRLDLFDDMRTAIRLARIGRDGCVGDAGRGRRSRWRRREAAAAIGRPDLGRLVAGSQRRHGRARPRRAGLRPDLRRPRSSFDRVVWAGSPDGGARRVGARASGRARPECTTADRTALRAEVTRRALLLTQ